MTYFSLFVSIDSSVLQYISLHFVRSRKLWRTDVPVPFNSFSHLTF